MFFEWLIHKTVEKIGLFYEIFWFLIAISVWKALRISVDNEKRDNSQLLLFIVLNKSLNYLLFFQVPSWNFTHKWSNADKLVSAIHFRWNIWERWLTGKDPITSWGSSWESRGFALCVTQLQKSSPNVGGWESSGLGYFVLWKSPLNM